MFRGGYDLSLKSTDNAGVSVLFIILFLTVLFSGKGCPYDNACIESFHATLKKEEVNLAAYYDFDAARLAIFEYIESWYNSKRIHSSIGYMTPQQFEDALRKTA